MCFLCQDVPGSSEHTTAVKPIDSFTARWALLAERVVASAEPLCVAVVGGGAGGVELCLAMQHALQQRLRAADQDPARVTFRLHTRGRLLAQHPPKVGRIFARILKERGERAPPGNVRGHIFPHPSQDRSDWGRSTRKAGS